MLTSRKELCYDIFFILMIAAKGLGLDSGDRLYYMLSMLATAAVAVKLLTTRYNAKEMMAMTLIGFIALAAYVNSGRLGIILSVLAVAGMKDMDIKKLFRTGLIVFGSAFAIKITGTVAGIFPNALTVHEKSGIGEVIRWGMGFSTGNVLHESYFILSVFTVYNMDRKYGVKQMLWLMAGNLLVFAFSLSYTGILVTSFYLLLGFYAAKRKQLGKAEQVMSQLVLPACLLCSFVPPFLVGTEIGDRLNELLQARPAFSHYYLTNQPITMFGARMKDVPGFWVIMDNGYVYYLMTFGIAAFAVFCLGYAAVIAEYGGIRRKNKESRNRELAVIYGFLIYGIMEQFISNAFMNISLFFLGEAFFAALNHKKEKAENEKTRRYLKLQDKGIFHRLVLWGDKTALPVKFSEYKGDLLWRKHIPIDKIKRAGKQKLTICMGIAFGIMFLIVYVIKGAGKEYVEVPLTAVNRIEAESMIFQFDTVYEDKKELKQEIKRYEEIVKGEDFLCRVLHTVEKEKGNIKELTADKIRAIIEISIPQETQKAEQYDNFRLRLLESYCDVPQEVYQAVLAEMAELLQQEAGLAGKIGEIYPESIGKSFGTDRIEHIVGNENYFVQKSGNIVFVERLRQGILRYIEGLLFGSAAAIMVLLVYDREKEKTKAGNRRQERNKDQL